MKPVSTSRVLAVVITLLAVGCRKDTVDTCLVLSKVVVTVGPAIGFKAGEVKDAVDIAPHLDKLDQALADGRKALSEVETGGERESQRAAMDTALTELAENATHLRRASEDLVAATGVLVDDLAEAEQKQKESNRAMIRGLLSMDSRKRDPSTYYRLIEAVWQAEDEEHVERAIRSLSDYVSVGGGKDEKRLALLSATRKEGARKANGRRLVAAQEAAEARWSEVAGEFRERRRRYEGVVGGIKIACGQ